MGGLLTKGDRKNLRRRFNGKWPVDDWMNQALDTIDSLEAERDHWQQRAEEARAAYIRARGERTRLRKCVEKFAKRTDGIGIIARGALEEVDGE